MKSDTNYIEIERALEKQNYTENSKSLTIKDKTTKKQKDIFFTGN